MNINTVMLIIIMNCVELFYTGDKGNTKYKQLSPVTLEMLIKLMASFFLFILHVLNRAHNGLHKA